MRYHVAHPTAQTSPRIENPYLDRAIRFVLAHRVYDGAKLVADFGYAVDELRELRRKRQIPAKAHTVERFTHKRTPRRQPILIEFVHRALLVPIEERVGKEVRQKPPFMILYVRNFRQHTYRYAATHTAYYRVKIHILEILAVRFGADPIVAQEHHRFLAVLVTDIHEFAHRFRNKPCDKVLPFLELVCRTAERIVVIAVIDKVFRRQLYARFLCERVDEHGISGLCIAEPLDVLFLAVLVEDERKLIQKGGKAYHVGVGVTLAPFPHMLLYVLFGSGICGIVRQLLFACPIIGDIIVYLHGMPGNPRQKRYRILVHSFGVLYRYFVLLLVYVPRLSRQTFSRGAVVHLPTLNLGIVRIELVAQKAGHKRYFYAVFRH